jgi:ABC-type transport system involved in multi-copper enzyme maturation permease subunit
LRAWCYLVVLSWQRQARAHFMVWIALGLLAFTLFVVGLNTWAGNWDMPNGFIWFSWRIILFMFVGFLLPIWSLSFATEALGREREGRNLVWVLTRPLSRPAIYLAKLLAALPWCLGFNFLGFGLICLAGGETGQLAFRLYWPAVLAASVAYAALFHLMGAWFRRAAVVAVLYSFFLESFMGSMPGYWKRLSISFYTRCLMFLPGGEYGVRPFRPDMYIPVAATTAWWVLGVATLLFLGLGMYVFSRSEYLDLS